MKKRNPKFMDETERFYLYVDKNGPLHPIFQSRCWLWTGAKIKGGYAIFRRSVANDPLSTKVLVHRFAFQMRYGAIPDGMEVDHMCRVRNCVNPHHLDVVTPTENKQRAGLFNRKDHCGYGHPMVDSNIYISGRQRSCKTCNFRRTAERRERLKNVTV